MNIKQLKRYINNFSSMFDEYEITGFVLTPHEICSFDFDTIDHDIGYADKVISFSIGEKEEIPDFARRMTPEELANFVPITNEEIDDALKRGERERDAWIINTPMIPGRYN